MQKLLLNEDGDVEIKKTFWRRQFQKETTETQRKFDWIFGVILPVICFVCDPGIFKGYDFGFALLGTIKPFAYLLSYVSVMMMAAWLIWGTKLKWLNAFLAGLFLIGGIVSFGIGLILLPFSLLGLIILIGVLGFTPLFASVVYFRNALRAFDSAKPFLDRKVLGNAYILGAMFSLIIPAVINLEINAELNRLIKSDAQTIRANSKTLKYLAPITNFDILVRERITSYYAGEVEKTQALRELHENLTGKN